MRKEAATTIRRAGFGAVLAVLSVPLMAASSCGNAGGSPAGGNGGGNPAQGSPAAAGTPAAKAAASAAPVAAGPAALGSRMAAKNGDAVTISAFGASPPTGNEFEVAGPGKECVQVTAQLANGSNTEWAIPGSELGVVDAAGQKYTSSSVNCGTSDDVQSLVAGGHATAKINFEVPIGSALNLSWVPNQFESEVYQTKLR